MDIELFMKERSFQLLEEKGVYTLLVKEGIFKLF